uniref:Uncharacterized protein MANES_01G177500 n=1 Tax=Rhizophora mucronata TaxID=61149 RepID=A0A2P2IK38_RHIMU
MSPNEISSTTCKPCRFQIHISFKIPKYKNFFFFELIHLLIFSRNSVFLLHLGDLLLLLLLVKLLAHLRLLVVQNDQVPVGDVEAREVVHSRLGVVDVLVDDEGGSASVLVGSDPDLADRPVLPEDIVHLLARDVEREVADVENPVHLRRKSGVPLPETDRRHRDLRQLVWMSRK